LASVLDVTFIAENVDCIIEGQAFSTSYDLAPSFSLCANRSHEQFVSLSVCHHGWVYRRRRGKGKGEIRSLITWRRESLGFFMVHSLKII